MIGFRFHHRLRGWLAVAALVGGTAALAQDPIADLRPTLQAIVPVDLSVDGYALVPPTITLKLVGTDPDAPDGRPARYRTLVKPAIDAAGNPIRTRNEYELHFAEVLGFEDPGWSEWRDYPDAPGVIEVPLVELPDGGYFLISTQLLDADGLTSNPFAYQVGTIHIRVLDGFYDPYIELVEPYLGTAIGTEMMSEIAPRQPLNFSWIASADAYGAEIASYRHGWDIISTDDPNDPGWAVPPGTAPENLFAAERTFVEGMHTFTLRVEDTSGGVRVIRWTLRVVPFLPLDVQLPLLVVDQVVDNNVFNWPDQSGIPRNDEVYRNAWWHFLAEGSGGVAGLNWDRDRFDHTETVTLSDLVLYRAVLCYAQANVAQTLFRDFRPNGDIDRYVWLTPYQQYGGNVFLVGASSMESFLEMLPNYMVPMIFDTTEETYVLDGQTFVVGFGETTLPGGDVVARGPRMYPYATAGISALDWTSPATKYIYARPYAARFDRTVDCVGLKGLVLDPDFRTGHGVAPSALVDTFWTDPVIDWQDDVAQTAGNLELFALSFPFRTDEFFDGNISSRPNPIVPQECVEGPAGRCIEPMYRGVARLDWMRELKRSAGDADWPQSVYSQYDLDTGCGPLALTAYEGVPARSARTNGQVFGFLSYKTVADKPSAKADVYWGFDPYRFDHAAARQAVRWVLDYFGLQINP